MSKNQSETPVPASAQRDERNPHGAVQRLASQLRAQGYIADEDLLFSLSLMESLGKPLLLEGEAGVGKTDIARALAAACQTRLLRLQCYEGLSAHQALYEWDYPRQLLAIQQSAVLHEGKPEESIYSEQYLLKRPLLAAISCAQPAVLLIDEIDRADEEFEALLLELLSDFQVSIPELGTIRARSVPRVILTSNGVRDLSDALRRRCLYHFIDYPNFDKELHIVRSRIPDIDQLLASQVVSFVQQLRLQNLRKTPGIAESIDWAMALSNSGISSLKTDRDTVTHTLSCVLKTQQDILLVRERYDELAGCTAEPGG